MDKQLLAKILPLVEKPARYTGGELYAHQKDFDSVPVRFAFAFPDVYEVGMSHLGLKILYEIINRRPDALCDRVFAPWSDMEALMRQEGMPLYGLESMRELADFDIVGFTLQYEMSYTNILNMLDLSGLPLHTTERASGPFIIAGGPCVCNPEPLAAFVDLFVFGDGEQVTGTLLNAYAQWKQKNGSREAFLQEAARIPGVYVPSLYREAAGEKGTYQGLHAIPPAKLPVEKQFITDLDAAVYPTQSPMPYLQVVHDRVMLELFRGCTHGCRFCQAGMLYRPVRERSVDRLVSLAREMVDRTGYEEVSLSSLSSGDYSRLEELIRRLSEQFQGDHVSFTLPSLRVDSRLRPFLDSLEGQRRTLLTFAPEAGTQRLRNVINKNITEDEIFDAVDEAFAAGYNSIKLYFMIGLPTETQDDLDGIVALVQSILQRYYAISKPHRPKGLSLTVSTSSFVPKPFTPFQWAAQDTPEKLREKQRYLQSRLKLRCVHYQWHDPLISVLEGLFARGGRPMGAVLEAAWRAGCRFDGWQEHFKGALWMEAIAQAGMDIGQELAQRSKEQALPWQHMHAGVSEDYLWHEWQRAQGEQTTPDCRGGCHGCGMQSISTGGICPCG